MGYTNYIPPKPAPDTSEKDAKKEVCKALYKYHGNQLSPQEVERILLDVNSKMDENDRKIGQKFDWDFTKSSEEIAAKFQKEAFFYLPKQDKFQKTLQEIRNWFFFADWNTALPHKTNGEIDWKKSLEFLAKERHKSYKKQSKSQAETNYKNLKEEIKTKVNAFFYVHAKKFPELTNLAELNQWVNTEAQKRFLAIVIKWERYKAAKRIGKESWSREIVPPDSISKAIFKNEKLNLTYKLNIYEIRDEKF